MAANVAAPVPATAAIPAAEFGSGSAAAWFRQAISPDGEIFGFFQEQVTAAVAALLAQANNPIEIHSKERLQAAVDDSCATAVQTEALTMNSSIEALEQAVNEIPPLTKCVEDLQGLENALDIKYEWRRFEKETTLAVWATAWDRVLVRQDQLRELAANMANPAVASAYGVYLQANKSEESRKLRRGFVPVCPSHYLGTVVHAATRRD